MSCSFVDEIHRTIEKIKAEDGDDEMQHVHEDDLYYAVLDHIRSGECTDPPSCAGEALKAGDLEFSRWCA